VNEPRRRDVIYHQNPFYDSMFGFFHLSVPSKRVRYRLDNQGQLIEFTPSQSGKEFEAEVRAALTPERQWPFRGSVFVVISIGLPEAEFRTKDGDNISKSLLDAMKGVVFPDDRQVVALFVNKHVTEGHWFMVGVREFREGDRGWYAPKLYSRRNYWKRPPGGRARAK
jgi:Holliday junction resolvase RusA-like endonuclease